MPHDSILDFWDEYHASYIGCEPQGARVYVHILHILNADAIAGSGRNFNGLVEGKIYRKAPYLMGTSMVSCKFSLKPIQSKFYEIATSCNITGGVVGH